MLSFRLLARGRQIALRSAAALRRTLLGPRRRLTLVVESADWTIRQVGQAMAPHLAHLLPFMQVRVATHAGDCFDELVHYLSLWSFLGASQEVLSRNRNVVTIFHGNPTADPVVAAHFEKVLRSIDHIDGLVTACGIMEERLLRFGFPRHKLYRIPLGVDVARFCPSYFKEEARTALGLPQDRLIIGSFQKDGQGWDEGLEPKLIKGPDVFCDVVGRLAESLPVFVLLTGPARGYVKRRLEDMAIPYHHAHLSRYEEIVQYYRCLDLYLVTAREEGGPLAILESLAAHVPLVTTRVGMAPDLLEDGSHALMADIGNVDQLTEAARRLLADRSFADALSDRGFRHVAVFDWMNISGLLVKEVYKLSSSNPGT